MNQFFQTSKTFYLDIKHYLEVYIEMILSLESFMTIRGSTYIV